MLKIKLSKFWTLIIATEKELEKNKPYLDIQKKGKIIIEKNISIDFPILFYKKHFEDFVRKNSGKGKSQNRIIKFTNIDIIGKYISLNEIVEILNKRKQKEEQFQRRNKIKKMLQNIEMNRKEKILEKASKEDCCFQCSGLSKQIDEELKTFEF